MFFSDYRFTITQQSRRDPPSSGLSDPSENPPVDLWNARPPVEDAGIYSLGAKEPNEKLGHRVKLIHVIGCGIARESQELESPVARLAQLLHSARCPMEHRCASQPH